MLTERREAFLHPRRGSTPPDHRRTDTLIDFALALPLTAGPSARAYLTLYQSRHIQSAEGIASFAASAVDLIAGTAWLFAREELKDAPVDYLFVDEAGQVSLADALAMGTCLRNVVLLGDPLRLAQVTQGTHPRGAGLSVLEHLLGEAVTVPSDRGIFLERTFRMHPKITRFVSEIVYEGRLRSAAT